jgi:peptidoglycan hydrolase-like protein with peptidoglycan-binding domain
MIVGTPYIPEQITVHLGVPSKSSRNVTVDFPYYVKNVVSSEIFPTWHEEAIKANTIVVVTYALNRIYTEWYRAKGYDFDITDTTQFDQKFTEGKEYFENIGIIVDEFFNDYIRRKDQVQPMFAAFCNGTTTTCDGLSQYGSEELAKQGYTYDQILKRYYGNDIDIVYDAPVSVADESYPGVVLKEGSIYRNPIKNMQLKLNRIRRNYPGIPRIETVDGNYDAETTAAVRKFQEVFNSPVTGEIDKGTWYKIMYIHNSVTKISELNSEGLRIADVAKLFTATLTPGMNGSNVYVVQYFLSVIAAYYRRVTPLTINSYYGIETEDSVRSFQATFGLPVTGITDLETFREIYNAYETIVEDMPIEDGNDVELYPGIVLHEGITSPNVEVLQNYLTYLHDFYPEIPAVEATGYFGPQTKASVVAFQERFNLDTDGVVGPITWNRLATEYSELKYGYNKAPYKFPGYVID